MAENEGRRDLPPPEPGPDGEPWRRRLVQSDAEPDIAPEHDSLTVDDDPLDKPAESDARWA